MDGQRGGVSYLLMPRPLDSLVKSPYVPVTYGWAIGSADGGVPSGLVALLVTWAATDLLLYPARYAVNDVLDREVDPAHPGAGQRGRIPNRLSLQTVQVMIGIRAAGLVLCVTLVGARARGPLVAAVVASVVAAAVYEGLRWWTGRRPLTGRAPARAWMPSLLWVWVGAGYGVRMGLGAACGGARPAVIAASVAAGWAFGCMFVVQGWSLEAAGLRRHGSSDQLAAKPHVATLVRDDQPEWKVLRSGPAAARSARFGLVATATATLLTLVLAGAPLTSTALAVAALVGVGTVAFEVAGLRTWSVVVGVGSVALALLCISGAVTWDSWERCGPLLIVLVTGTVFTRSGPELVGVHPPTTCSAHASALDTTASGGHR